jgi:toxin-antitoxin system PIN domain toxin
VILVDANLLLYAEDSSSPYHRSAARWWDGELSGGALVCLCWPVISAYLRLATHPRVFRNPLSMKQAAGRVQSWLDQSCVQVLVPGRRHWDIVHSLLIEAQAIGNLVSDAHVAAIAIEYACELQSSDRDFSRFTGLKWKNPIAGAV